MIMTDQDHDGSHIKGLIMNFLHAHFPSLLRVPGFLLEFITPIIKATKGKQTMTFYTMPEYENWKEANNTRGWSIKYYKVRQAEPQTDKPRSSRPYLPYNPPPPPVSQTCPILLYPSSCSLNKSKQPSCSLKNPRSNLLNLCHVTLLPRQQQGLGTSTAKEAKEYFADLDEHVKEFVWGGDNDGEAIEMAFSKKRVDERKTWLQGFTQGTFLDHSATHISYSEFVHKELILFSRADLERSIPCVLDGLKPGQRKILYACFKRNLK